MKKVVINKKKVAALVAAGMLAFTLAACGGNRDTSPDPTPPNNPGIEQPNNGNDQQNNAVESFDPSTVSIVSIEAVSNPAEDSMDLRLELVDGLDETMKKAIDRGIIMDVFSEGQNHNTITFLMNDVDLNNRHPDAMGSAYGTAQRMAIAELAIDGELSDVWVAFFAEEIREQATSALMNIKQVIDHAKETGDNTHVIRLLAEATAHPDKNNFTNLQAAILIAHLKVRGSQPERDLAEDEMLAIYDFYENNRGR